MPIPDRAAGGGDHVAEFTEVLRGRDGEEIEAAYVEGRMRRRLWNAVRFIREWPKVVADYTAGTIIVLFLGPPSR
jgi:hypothetical protein